jgi:hypothetical protein
MKIPVFGIYHVKWNIVIDVSEETAASIFRVVTRRVRYVETMGIV